MARQKTINDLIPSQHRFVAGIERFRKYETRDALYRVARQVVNDAWFRPIELADGVGAMVIAWNQAHFRYGPPSIEKLQRFLVAHQSALESFRRRDIHSFESIDGLTIAPIFDALLKALAISRGKSRGKKSPVAVAKTLHLLSPDFFPLWDRTIANVYGCDYSESPSAAYLRFTSISKGIVESRRNEIAALRLERSELKVVDEYNFGRFVIRNSRKKK